MYSIVLPNDIRLGLIFYFKADGEFIMDYSANTKLQSSDTKNQNAKQHYRR